MSTAKVYGSIFSTCTQRVLIVLEEVGATYELIDVDMKAGQHKVCSKLGIPDKNFNIQLQA
jgi:hypothetical protein